LIFIQHDSLSSLELGSGRIDYFARVPSYEIARVANKEYVVYALQDGENALIFNEVSTHILKKIRSIKRYAGYSGKSTFFLEILAGTGMDGVSLGELHLPGFQLDTIWSTANAGTGIDINGIALDTLRERMAFETTVNGKKSIWCYDRRERKAGTLDKRCFVGNRK